MKGLLREPLVHFLLLGAVIFMAYSGLSQPGGEEQGKITITQGQIDNLVAGFARTWQRPPSPDELVSLVRDRVQEEVYYREALALGLDDVYLLAAWSDFLLDAGRPDEVTALLARWEGADSLLLRLAEAETTLKRPEAARHVQALADRFASARLRGDATHRAEEARYQLRLRGDAKQALRLAADNYRVQREPRDARILLEAAAAAGDPAPAGIVREWLQRSGFEDARLRQLARALRASPPAPAASAAR